MSDDDISDDEFDRRLLAKQQEQKEKEYQQQNERQPEQDHGFADRSFEPMDDEEEDKHEQNHEHVRDELQQSILEEETDRWPFPRNDSHLHIPRQVEVMGFLPEHQFMRASDRCHTIQNCPLSKQLFEVCTTLNDEALLFKLNYVATKIFRINFDLNPNVNILDPTIQQFLMNTSMDDCAGQ